MTDHNEALRLADALVAIHEHNADSLLALNVIKQAGPLIRQLSAERDQLRAEVERLQVDAERIDYLEYEINELRTRETAEDDYEWVVRSNHMDQPHERDVATGKTIRAAIDTARKEAT